MVAARRVRRRVAGAGHGQDSQEGAPVRGDRLFLGEASRGLIVQREALALDQCCSAGLSACPTWTHQHGTQPCQKTTSLHLPCSTVAGQQHRYAPGPDLQVRVMVPVFSARHFRQTSCSERARRATAQHGTGGGPSPAPSLWARELAGCCGWCGWVDSAGGRSIIKPSRAELGIGRPAGLIAQPLEGGPMPGPSRVERGGQRMAC